MVPASPSSTREPCLILGGAGFLGAHLARALVAAGHPVTAFDRPAVSFRRLDGLDTVRRVEGDFLNEADLRPWLAEHPLLFHFVGNTSPAPSNDNPVYDAETNVVATLRLLELAAGSGVRRVFFPSSGGTVYGPAPRKPRREDDPTHPIASYGISKLTVEKYLELYRRLRGLDYVVLRFSNPYGADQGAIGVQGAVTTFLRRVHDGQALEIWGDGTVTRDFVHVDDAVGAVVRALHYAGPHRVFNVGSGVGTTLLELVEVLRRVTGRAIEVRHLPARAVDVPWNVLDVYRAREELGWQAALDLEQGVRGIWEAWRA